jgi:hypothetical protein
MLWLPASVQEDGLEQFRTRSEGLASVGFQGIVLLKYSAKFQLSNTSWESCDYDVN